MVDAPEGTTAPDQNTELDAIMREAQSIEGASTEAAQPVEVKSNTAKELRGAFGALRVMAKPMFYDWPDFSEVWSDQTLQDMADSGGDIMDRHGWTLREFMSEWGPYIALIAAVGPAGIATYQHLKIRKEKAQNAPQERPRDVSAQQAAN